MATGQGIRAGRAFVELFADDSKLVRGLRGAERRLQAFGASVRAMGARLFAAGALVAGPLSLAVQAASDMEETMNKFNVVFGDNAAAMQAWGDQFAGQMGRSKRQIADFLAGTQDLLVPIGFDAGSAEQMSQQLTGLAIDLASFNNLADADVLRDLHAALTGSGEVMKKYGVLVSEAAVQQELFNQGIDKSHASEQQKVMARLNIILRGTTAAQGDALRSANSFANQLKALKAQVEDAAVEIGTALLPVVTPLVTRLASGVKVLGAWIKQHSALVVRVAQVAAILAGVGGAFFLLGSSLGLAGTALGGLATALTTVGAVLAMVLSPLGLVTAAVVGLGGYLLHTSGIGAQALGWLSDQFEILKVTALAAWQGISDALAAGDIGLAARILWLTLKMEWQRGIEALNQLWVGVKEFFLSVWTEAVYGAARIATEAWAGLQTAWTETIAFLADAWTVFTTGITQAWYTAVGFIRKAWVRLKSLFDSELNADAEITRITQEVSAQQQSATDARDRQLTERDQARRQRLSAIEAGRTGTLSELDRMREADHLARQRRNQADLQASEEALNQARQEWQQAIAEAARQRPTGEANAPSAGGRPNVAALGTELQQRAATARNIEFGLTQAQQQAIQLQALGAGATPPDEQTAKNTQQMITELKAQNKTLRDLLAQQRKTPSTSSRPATIG